MKANFGIDAPELVKTFFMVSAATSIASLCLWRFATPHWEWASWVAGILLVPAVYSLGMFVLMVWESLVAKINSRDVILDQLHWIGTETVLDVGCGRGLMLVGAAGKLTSGRAVGVDIWLDKDQSSNTKSAPLLNAQIEGVADRVAVETADMRNLPFGDCEFDVVVSSWAVHNLEAKKDRLAALREIYRVLRPEGTLLLTDIVNRREYAAALKELGMRSVEIFIESEIKDWLLSVVSFGAYQPSTIIAKK